MKKLIIVTAPSGAGKTTIVRHLLNTFDELAFSVSATNRKRRKHEKEGRDYYFITTAAFKRKIKAGEFVEWEEVYDNQFYGTLKSEVERLRKLGKHIIFDIDVNGAENIKKAYPEDSIAIFVKPPTPEVLFERLKARKTENEESLRKRIARAKHELTFENNFDIILVNNILEEALYQAERIVENFINN